MKVRRLILVRHKKILHGQKFQRSAKHSIHWCAVSMWLLNPTQWCLLLLSKIIPPNMSALVVSTSAPQGEVLWHPRETLPDYCGLSCLWLFPRRVKLNLVVSNGATQWSTQCFKESWNPQPYYVIEILRTLILSNFQHAMTCYRSNLSGMNIIRKMKAIYNLSLNSSLVAKLFCPHILIHNNFVLQNLNKRDINLIRRIKPCVKCEISVTSKWENECIIKTNSISHIQYMRIKVCTRFVMFCCVGQLSILHTFV